MTKVRVFGKGEQSPQVGDVVTFQIPDNPSLVGTARVIRVETDAAPVEDDEFRLKCPETGRRIAYEWSNGDPGACTPERFGPWRMATEREAAAFESATPDLRGSALADQLYSGWQQWERTKARAGAKPGIPGIGRGRSGDA